MSEHLTTNRPSPGIPVDPPPPELPPVAMTPEEWLESRKLPAREREAALLAARGLLERQIADEMAIALPTVKGYVANACARLGFRTVHELRLGLLRAGVVKPEQLFPPPEADKQARKTMARKPAKPGPKNQPLDG